MDLIVPVPHLPQPGETVLSPSHAKAPGGDYQKFRQKRRVLQIQARCHQAFAQSNVVKKQLRQFER